MIIHKKLTIKSIKIYYKILLKKTGNNVGNTTYYFMKFSKATDLITKSDTLLFVFQSNIIIGYANNYFRKYQNNTAIIPTPKIKHFNS